MNIEPFFLSAKKLFSREDSTIKIDPEAASEQTLRLSDKEMEQAGPPDKLPAEVERRYIIRRILGKGAFGIVYLAEDRRLGRFVAVKQLLKPYTKEPEIIERFMQEARIGAQLDHPNILNVFALEEDENSACIIMEYMGGGSLAGYLQKQGRLDVHTAVRIFAGILNGLDAAHHVMVIHRDIKPQNILFGPRGEPKISDFGVAHLPVSAGGATSISNDMRENIIGTPLYMSPEQILRQTVDSRTDLYSAGAVMYEMLTGRKIFNFGPAARTGDIIGMITGVLPEPIAPSPKIPDGLRELVMKLLSKKADDRFASARDVLARMQELFQNSELVQTNLIQDGTLGTTGPLLSSPAAMLEDVIRLLMIDGSLTSSERKELERRAERLGVSKLQAELIEDKVRAEMRLPSLQAIREFTQVAEAFYTTSPDMKISAEQIEFMNSRGKELEISSKEMNSILAEVRARVRYKRLSSDKS